MSPEDDVLGDPIPLDFGDDTVPDVSKAKPGHPEPLRPIADPSRIEGADKIRTFDAQAALGGKKADSEFKRPLNQPGQGASRVRTFHARLSGSAMDFLDEQINDWLEGNPEISIKFASSTVGVVEGKRADPHLIITVWY